MFTNILIFACALSAALAQVEQGIFAQLYYPPLPRYREVATEAPVTEGQPKSDVSPDHPSLSVRPIPGRFKRSGFSKDQDVHGNDVDLERVRSLMVDPTWNPTVLSRLSNNIQ